MKMKLKDKEHESGVIRVEPEIVVRVKKHVKKTRQTVGGFFSLAAEKELEYQKNNPQA